MLPVLFDRHAMFQINKSIFRNNILIQDDQYKILSIASGSYHHYLDGAIIR